MLKAWKFLFPSFLVLASKVSALTLRYSTSGSQERRREERREEGGEERRGKEGKEEEGEGNIRIEG